LLSERHRRGAKPAPAKYSLALSDLRDLRGEMAAAELAVVILAAGKGTRMRSRLPKVLHPVCGRPILLHAVHMARELGAKRIVVVAGHGAAQVREALAGCEVDLCEQREQLGTAHAALQAEAALAGHQGPVVVMHGDHPLYRAATLQRLLDAFERDAPEVALLTAELPDPTGYGRIVRDAQGRVQRVAEERDADEATRRIREVNLAVYVSRGPYLFDALRKIGNHNAKREYYLPDLVDIALRSGGRVAALAVPDWLETLGVNDRAQLAEAERIMRARINERWMLEGVTLVDPAQTYIDASCQIGPDTVIEPGVQLRRGTRVGEGCRIEAGVVIDGSQIGDGSWIKPHCWIEDSQVGRGCIIGPSAHLRPGVELGADCRIGNFVEIKNSRIGPGTKADHLSYIGDADLGAGVTFACGAVTVNYDGRHKHRTTIGEKAFVGCNANLIAPVTIEPRAFVAAGSTVTRQVPAGALAVARAEQRNVEGWRARKFGPDDHSGS
jgi:bifunctional UDP-N-acetylglucosamine pyrophosphorylase/glucosamine-1-phosphate N-acetyltransferase